MPGATPALFAGVLFSTTPAAQPASTLFTRLMFLLILILASAAPVLAAETIENSPHDLSVQSPNRVRAVAEEQICVFCHAPHTGGFAPGGWNRFNPSVYYRVYRSTTLEARVDQPYVRSRMCLSCHDGSMPLGQVLSRPATDPIPMTSLLMPPGPWNLTTDLSDDHPISFRYDRALSNADRQLYDPQRISRQLPLGPRNQVDCMTCHDPHSNQQGNFLRLPQKRGALCATCHDLFGWPQSAHANSPKHVSPVATGPDQRFPYVSVADNGCANCHDVHGAPQPARLLRHKKSQETCLVCHDGTVAANILQTLGLPYNHKGNFLLDRHSPVENPRTMPAHVTCVDCHNPHAVQPGPKSDHLLQPLILNGPLKGAPGVSITGRLLRHADQEYEVCLRCHGDNPVKIRDTIPRVIPDPNLRRVIAPGAASSHPFVRVRSASEVPSLLPGLANKRISCSDCHNANDARAFGGTAPNGPHGSIHKHLVALRYDTNFNVTENAQAYALCYRCHSRESILGNQSFSLHSQHVVTARIPCSACHDPHGVPGARTRGSHLVNFDRTRVSPVAGAGGIEYVERGRFTGTCTLQCHGVNHVNFIYSPATVPPGAGGFSPASRR
jgi:predicted CXXCH cytochrome family protein